MGFFYHITRDLEPIHELHDPQESLQLQDQQRLLGIGCWHSGFP